MGYGVMAYLLDTDDLLKLVDGSQKKKTGFLSSLFSKKNKDKELILKQFKRDFDDLDEGIREMMEDDDEIGQYSLSRQVLDEFLSHDIKNSSYDHIYGYVFKILCEYLGKYLDNSEWYPCSIDSHFNIPFTNMILPVKFPISGDWPSIDRIAYQDIDLANAKFENMDEDQKFRLLDWFAQAIENKKDIYLFMH